MKKRLLTKPEHFISAPETFRADQLTDSDLIKLLCDADFRNNEPVRYSIAEKEAVYRRLELNKEGYD